MTVRRSVVAICWILFLISSVQAGQQSKSSALDGVWVAKSITYQGQVKLPPKDSVKFTFAGEKLVVVGFGGAPEVVTTFTVHDTETPKRLDFPILKTKIEGIYRIENGSLTFAIPQPGKPRLTTFEGSEAVVFVFSRAQ